MSKTTGKMLNERWTIGAQHSLYSRRGNWYHRLEHFPGALCDPTGYILFDSPEAVAGYPGIAVSGGDKNWISVARGISSPGDYVKCDP